VVQLQTVVGAVSAAYAQSGVDSQGAARVPGLRLALDQWPIVGVHWRAPTDITRFIRERCNLDQRCPWHFVASRQSAISNSGIVEIRIKQTQ
jgi:hypothetical protein